MIAYTMVGTQDLATARAFYDPLFADMGWQVCWQDQQAVSYGVADDLRVARFIVGRPFDGRAASVGNGVMTAFRLEHAAQVDRLHALALRLGGRDEGAPGPRPQYGDGFYAAYVRDRDGHKLAFVVYPDGAVQT